MPTIDKQVAASADDAGHVEGDETWSIISTYHTIGTYWSEETKSGLRFLDIIIPPRPKIITAYLELYGNAGGDDSIETDIHGEDNGTPATFSTQADFDARTPTVVFVTWSTSGWIVNDYNRGPEMKTVVQELVDKHDYSGGLNMAFLLFGQDQGGVNKCRYWMSYDVEAPPKLHIEWSVVAPSSMVAKMIGARVL